MVELLGQDFLEGKCLQMPGNDRIWMNMGYYGVIWWKMMPGLHRPHGKPLKSFEIHLKNHGTGNGTVGICWI